MSKVDRGYRWTGRWPCWLASHLALVTGLAMGCGDASAPAVDANQDAASSGSDADAALEVTADATAEVSDVDSSDLSDGAPIEVIDASDDASPDTAHEADADDTVSAEVGDAQAGDDGDHGGGVDDVDDVDGQDADSEVAADAANGVVDMIFGVAVSRGASWWVDKGTIGYGASQVDIRGINWFGLETFDRALHGLWSGRSLDDFLTQITDLGFNSLRVPLSPESIREGYASQGWANHDEVDTGREHLEELIERTGAHGIQVLLDIHTCDPSLGGGSAGAPDVCAGYETEDWLEDLTTLATLAIGHPHVMGIDLFNEPHALTWNSWSNFVEAGAKAVLEANPRLLVFVEGIGNETALGLEGAFWGENLADAGADPPSVPLSRLVYSPHTYGPGVYWQSYFSDPDFPDNLPAIWDAHFGYLMPEMPIVIGEFGGHYDDNRQWGEVLWNEAFIDYLVAKDVDGFFYWALNPNSHDTGGLLMHDWMTPVPEKLELLAPLLGN